MGRHVSEIIINSGYAGLNPMQFGYEDCSPSHFFGPAVRNHWLLHYVVSGEGIFQIGEEVWSIRPGEMFVIPPYVETYYQADEKDPWHYIWIGFTTDSTLPATLKPRMYCPGAGSIFEKMKKCEGMELGKSAYLAARLWDLMSALLELERLPVDHIEKALNCMYSEYMNGIGVNEIARRLNLERSYFSTLFKKRMGVSPQAFLLDLRMENAARLMTQQGMSPTTAANSVGYSDIFNFSRMFKRKYGVSPREYKRNNG